MTAALNLVDLARSDITAKRVLADTWLEHGRDDVARLMLDVLPRDMGESPRLRKRVEKMTQAEAAQMKAWAQKWIAIGLSTQPADRVLFEAGCRACYRHSGLAEPERIVWCPNPLVVVLAGPKALAVSRGQGDSVHASVGDSVHASVRDSVGDSVHASEWWRYLGGQFWVGWYWWGPASVTYALDVLRLDIGREMELRARAYAATCMSACWWYPTMRVVFVSERPRVLTKWPNGKLRLAEWEGFKVERTEDGGTP